MGISLWLCLAAGLCRLALGQFGSTTDVPILLDGGLDGATVDDDSFNAGGTITVNGWTVTVPKNMLVTFPNAFVSWPDFVAEQDAFKGFEMNIAGNIVNGSGESMAAQIYIAQYGLEFNQGYITAVNNDGTLQIQNGPLVKVNDPNGVFGAPSSDIPFMVADDESPSVSSFSGFPMCIPRSDNDTLCPASNRPDANGGSRSFQAPDPLVMAPFLVGDFITYTGVKLASGVVSAYEIVAGNVEITTTGAPSYIRVEEAQIGIYLNDANVEIQETRFIGYTSDPNALVSVSALILDPCTGIATEQGVGVGELRPDAGGRNKFTARIDGTTAVDYSREYRLTASTGTVLTKNGLLAGQYVTPIAAWVQPELLNPSLPPPPNEFSRMTHLTRGVGVDQETGNLFGPLEPFPQSNVAVANTSTCALAGNGSTAPVPALSASIALSGGSFTSSTDDRLFVRSGDTFQLLAQQINPDIEDDGSLIWEWELVEGVSAGTVASLSSNETEGNTTYIASFLSNAPTGDYVFRCNITAPGTPDDDDTVDGDDDDNVAMTGSANITITVFSGSDSVSVQTVTWTSAQSGTIGVICASNYWVDTSIGMSVQYAGKSAATTSVMSPTPPNSGVWSFSARSADEPGTVVCSSRLGGFATRVGVTT